MTSTIINIIQHLSHVNATFAVVNKILCELVVVHTACGFCSQALVFVLIICFMQIMGNHSQMLSKGWSIFWRI